MNDPVLIFFVALAAFLSYRLFSVLGSRGGHEPKEEERITPFPRSGEPQRSSEEEDRPTIVSEKELPDWAKTVRADIPDFDPDHFLEGAKAAYELIVTSFAEGNLDEIRAYVDAEVLKAFESAVEGRRRQGQTMEANFIGIESARVDRAERVVRHVEVQVTFRSDQVRLLRDAQGEVIEGDPNRIDLVVDHWTFSRPAGSKDPNWTLTATDGDVPDA